MEVTADSSKFLEFQTNEEKKQHQAKRKKFKKIYEERRDTLLEIYYLLGYSIEACVVFNLFHNYNANGGTYCENVDLHDLQFIKDTKCSYYKRPNQVIKCVENIINQKKDDQAKKCKTLFGKKNNGNRMDKVNSGVPYTFSLTFDESMFNNVVHIAREIGSLDKEINNLQKDYDLLNNLSNDAWRRSNGYSAIESHEFYSIIQNYLRSKLSNLNIPLLSNALDSNQESYGYSESELRDCEFLISCWQPKLRYAYEGYAGFDPKRSYHHWYEFIKNGNTNKKTVMVTMQNDVKQLNSLLNINNLKIMLTIASNIFNAT